MNTQSIGIGFIIAMPLICASVPELQSQVGTVYLVSVNALVTFSSSKRGDVKHKDKEKDHTNDKRHRE